ncbi:hypothetical protein K4K58_008897 [Colletotrichum sp. SAR11_239]|nr:hypothetical protein K4K58_008897 [Colletotrichum sp. SAR11_239]
MGGAVSSLKSAAKGTDDAAHASSPGKQADSAVAHAAGNGLPSNAKPAGEDGPGYATWLAIGNTAAYGIYGTSSDPGELPPVPVEWIIAPKTVSAGQCPSVGHNITTFIVTDVVAGIIAAIFCCRPIVKKMTFGRFGKLPNKTSRWCSSVWWTWLISLLLALGGNLGITLFVVNAEGYTHLSKLIIFALYASRPRINMVVVALLRVLVAVRTKDWSKAASYKPVEKEELESQDTTYSGSEPTTKEGAGDGSDSEKLIIKIYDGTGALEKEYVYIDSYRSTVVAEIILNTISAVFVGVTWGRFPNQTIKTYMNPKTIFMQTAPAISFVGAIFAIPAYWKRGRYVDDKWVRGLAGAASFGTAYAAPWVYWYYFLQLPGALWCPPKLPIQAIIWTAFSLAGNILA